MTTSELIEKLQELDPEGTAEVLEERNCDLRSLKEEDVSSYVCGTNPLMTDDGEEFTGRVISLSSWS